VRCGDGGVGDWGEGLRMGEVIGGDGRRGHGWE
jgi:hypothetical protein